MPKVIETEEFIEIQSPMPVGKRVLFLLMSCFPFLAPYELILRPDWEDYRNLFFLMAAGISVGALAVSALLVWAALAGLSSTLRFDRAQGILTYTAGAPIIRWRAHRCPIADISHLRVEKHDWSEGSPSYSFRAHMEDGTEFRSGSSWSKEEIEEIYQRVSAFLGLSDRARPE